MPQCFMLKIKPTDFCSVLMKHILRLNDIKEKCGVTRLGPVSAQYVLRPLWVCCSGRCLPHGLWREEHVAVVG